MGVVGIASYVGAGVQDVMSGILIEGNKMVMNGVETYDFTAINWFWIGAALLSTLCALLPMLGSTILFIFIKFNLWRKFYRHYSSHFIQ